MVCSLSDSSVHGILQARILEWVAIPFSRESSQTKDQTLVSYIAGRFLPYKNIIIYITTISAYKYLFPP